MSENRLFSIESIKQELLVNAVEDNAKLLFEYVDDSLIKQLEIVEIKNNQSLLKVDVKLTPEKKIIASVAFAFKYKTLSGKNSKGDFYIVFGKYSDQILISDENKMKDIDYLKNEFIGKHIRVIFMPLLNKVSKCLYDVTEETINIPLGMDTFEKFVSQLNRIEKNK